MLGALTWVYAQCISLVHRTATSRDGETEMTSQIKAASFYAGRKNGQKVAYLTLEVIENGRRHTVDHRIVSGKAEARKVAEASGYRPWNF